MSLPAFIGEDTSLHRLFYLLSWCVLICPPTLQERLEQEVYEQCGSFVNYYDLITLWWTSALVCHLVPHRYTVRPSMCLTVWFLTDVRTWYTGVTKTTSSNFGYWAFPSSVQCDTCEGGSEGELLLLDSHVTKDKGSQNYRGGFQTWGGFTVFQRCEGNVVPFKLQ